MLALCGSADDFVLYNGKKDNRYMKNKNDWLDFISATGWIFCSLNNSAINMLCNMEKFNYKFGNY